MRAVLSSFTSLFVCALAIVMTVAAPVSADGEVTIFSFEGESSYYFDMVSLSDVHDMHGWFDFCDATEAPACAGTFHAEGTVYALGGYTGPGTLEIEWNDGGSSGADALFVGLPDATVILATIESGTYLGQEIELVVSCALEDQLQCWDLYGATYDIHGIAELGSL